jgi:hypothetical protein
MGYALPASMPAAVAYVHIESESENPERGFSPRVAQAQCN